MITAILAVLSVSAAGGMRIALPLLAIGLIRTNEFWSNMPFLSHVHPAVLLCILTSWSLFELLGSKQLLGQRVLQLMQLAFSPVVGALLALSVVQMSPTQTLSLATIALIGGSLALVLQLVQVGWFFRLRGLPMAVMLLEDVLCIALVFLAFRAPVEGGLLALGLLGLAIASAQSWQRWTQARVRS